MKSLNRQRGAVQLLILPAIMTAIVSIGTWLASAWTALWAAVTSYAVLKYTVGFIVAAAWLATFAALIVSVTAIMPTAGLDTAVSNAESNTLYNDIFVPWFAFMKPAGTATYIAAVTSTWAATAVYRTWATILELRSYS